MTTGFADGTPRPPGSSDAVRATLGAVVAYAVALAVAALVALVSGAANDGIRSAGDTRAQLAVQALVFAGAALLLVEGLRLAHRPRERDPLAAAAGEVPVASEAGRLIVVGVAAAGIALLAGPLVSAVLPGLRDSVVLVDELGLGKGIGADVGTVLVVAGLVPLGEELLFRGVLVGAWTRAGRPGLAIAVSAVLFGLAHLTVGPRAMVVMTLLGAVLAVAMLAGRSLGAPVLAHTLINGVALVDAGIRGPVPLIVLVATVILVTIVAARISRSVSLPAPAGTLEQ